ncbi:MAG TPA: hypothetical protein VGC80_03810 [Acetobacteraceae bacterium]
MSALQGRFRFAGKAADMLHGFRQQVFRQSRQSRGGALLLHQRLGLLRRQRFDDGMHLDAMRPLAHVLAVQHGLQGWAADQDDLQGHRVVRQDLGDQQQIDQRVGGEAMGVIDDQQHPALVAQRGGQRVEHRFEIGLPGLAGLFADHLRHNRRKGQLAFSIIPDPNDSHPHSGKAAEELFHQRRLAHPSLAGDDHAGIAVQHTLEQGSERGAAGRSDECLPCFRAGVRAAEPVICLVHSRSTPKLTGSRISHRPLQI